MVAHTRSSRGALHKLLAVFLSLVLAVSFIPANSYDAYADDGDSYERSLPQDDEEAGDGDGANGGDSSPSAQNDEGVAADDSSSVILSEGAEGTEVEGSQTDEGAVQLQDDGDATTAWDGSTIDTSWYNTTDTTFTISTAAQLAGLAAITTPTSYDNWTAGTKDSRATGIKVDDFKGKTVKLSANIDLGNQLWYPIADINLPGERGTYDGVSWRGTFDGGGYTVTNMNADGNSNNGSSNFYGYQGLFSAIGADGIIRNVGVTGTITARCGGGIAGVSNVEETLGDEGNEISATLTTSPTEWPRIENCWSNVTITGNGSGSRGCGGIFGGEGDYRSMCNIVNCYALGSIVSNSSGSSGGVAGILNGAIGGCYNVGSVSGRYEGCIVATLYMPGSTTSKFKGVGSFANNMGIDTACDNLYRYINSTTDSNPVAVEDGFYTAAEIKAGVTTLGAAYSADSTNINSGYPVLFWQAGGSQQSIEGATIADIETQTYTGSAIEPALTVTKDSATLVYGRDYIVSYANNIEPGTNTATATVYGVGLYTGQLEAATFTIREININDVEIAAIANQWRYSEPVTPALTVTDTSTNTTLTEGKDYTVAYTNNDAAGEVTATITVGRATKSANFYIEQAATSLQGSGTEADPYLISTRGEMQFFSHMVNTAAEGYATASYKLKNDINLTTGEQQADFEQIGAFYSYKDADGKTVYVYNYFCGSFDGDGHTLTLALTQSPLNSYADTALFANVGDSSVDPRTEALPKVSIKNLTVSGSVTGRAAAGIVSNASMADLTIENCVNKATIKGQHTNYNGYIEGTPASGIVYMCSRGEILNCVNEGTVLGKGSATGGGVAGIVSLQNSTGGYDPDGNATFVISGCTNNGQIATATLETNPSLNTKTYYGYDSVCAGILGSTAMSDCDVLISKCANTGTVGKASTFATVGGILGNVNAGGTSDLVIDVSYNSGAISGTGTVGGIAAMLMDSYSAIVNSCYNTGAVSLDPTAAPYAASWCYVGGLVGGVTYAEWDDVSPYRVSGYNTGTVSTTDTSACAGILVGTCDSNYVPRTIELRGDFLKQGSLSALGYSNGDVTVKNNSNYVTSEVLKALPSDLGSAFVENTGTTNDGYPLLWWQTDTSGSDLSEATAGAIPDQTYEAWAIEPDTTLTFDGVALVEDTDYLVSYSNNVNVGTATVTFTGLGIFSGTSNETTFKIVPANIATAAIANISNQTYTGSAIEPKVTVADATEGVDFDVAYEDNIEVGTAKALIFGFGNYTGYAEKTFNIVKADLTACTIDTIEDQVATGEALTPALTVTNAAGALLVPGIDYKAYYFNNVEIGTARVSIVGIGGYEGGVSTTFEIVAGDIADAAISGIEDFYDYTGEAITITPVVTLGETVLTQGTDYTFAITDGNGNEVSEVKDKGSYTATVTGTGLYTGSESITFTVGAYFTVYTQEGASGTPTVVKEYNQAEFEALKATGEAATDVSMLAYRRGSWNVYSSNNYVTVSSILTDAGISDQFVDGTSLSIGAYGDFMADGTWQEYQDQNQFFPEMKSDSTGLDNPRTVEAVIALEYGSSSIADGQTAGEVESTNLANQSTDSCPRLLRGVSAEQVNADSKPGGNRSPQGCNCLILITPEPTFFTVYTQAGTNGTPKVAKEYTRSEFEALKSDSTDPVSGLYYRTSTWNVTTATTYVTLEDLFADAGVSELWNEDASIAYGGDPAQSKQQQVFSYSELNSMNKFYPDAQLTNTATRGETEVVPVLSLTEYSSSTSPTMTAAQAQEYNIEHANTTNTPRIVYGVSQEAYLAQTAVVGKGNVAGMRYWSSNESLTIITPPEKNVTRLAGEDALGTMRAAVGEGFADDSCDYAVIATRDTYYDALAAAGLAGIKQAPILLTAPDALSAETAAEIERIASKDSIHIYIAGGVSAVSQAVEDSLNAMDCVEEVKRVSGDNAIGTANDIYEEGAGSWGGTAFIATTNSYHDALSASSYAWAKQSPIFLTDAGSELSSDTLANIVAGGFDKVVILGGISAVSSAVETQLTSAGIAWERKDGTNAYETSNKVAKWALENGLDNTVMAVATGTGHYDALSGAALCGKNGAALILADESDMTTVNGVLTDNLSTLHTVYLLGGTGVVTQATEDAIKALMGVE